MVNLYAMYEYLTGSTWGLVSMTVVIWSKMCFRDYCCFCFKNSPVFLLVFSEPFQGSYISAFGGSWQGLFLHGETIYYFDCLHGETRGSLLIWLRQLPKSKQDPILFHELRSR